MKYIFSLFIIIPFLISEVLFPSIVLAESSSLTIDARPVQYKTVKEFSGKYCDAILAGLTKENALRLASRELYKSLFKQTFWSSAYITKGEEVKNFNSDKLILLASENIIRECGTDLGISGEQGIKSVEEYLNLEMDSYLSKG